MRNLLYVVLILLAGCAGNARLTGDQPVARRELLREAARPLQAYAAPDGRPSDLVDASEAMRARLDREGYPAATVTAQAGRPPTFVITTGPRVRIAEVVFTGDLGLPLAELEAAAASGAWFTSTAGGAVRTRLRSVLRAAGHLDAVVEVPREEWSEDRTRVALHVALQAGPRFVLSAVQLDLADAERWPGMRERLEALLDQPGSVLLPRSPSIVAARLRGLLFDLGHREAEVEVAQRRPAPGEIEMRFAVRPGPVHVVRSVTVDGGRRSAPGFIARRLEGLVPGQALSQAAIDACVTAFLSTGLFRRAEVLPSAGLPLSDGSVPDEVQVRLREQPTQHIDLAVGYGTYERVRGGVTYVDEHILGRGLRFTAGLEASTVGWEANTSLADPFSFGPGRRLTLESAYLERQEPSYAHREASVGLLFSRRLREGQGPAFWEVRPGHRFARQEDYHIEAIDPAQPSKTLYTTSTVRLDLRRDSRRPRVIDPDAGTLARIGLGWSAAPLGATVDYAEAGAEWSGAWSPAPWLVGTVRGAATTRDPGVVTSLPIGERLFLGGSDTVRSYSQDELGPRAAEWLAIGGLTSAVANLELRWRPFAEHRQLEFATFYDLGCVDPEAWSLGEAWGAGVGAGLRYRTPVGPIRFDAALDPAEGDGSGRRYALNLTVGFAF